MFSTNKSTSVFENSITVTPIKVECDMDSYPTPSSGGNSVALAATTSGRRSSTAVNSQQTNNYLPGNTTTTFLPTNSAVTTNISNTGAIPKEQKIGTKSARSQGVRKPPPTVDTFWPNILAEVRNIQQVDAKHQALPLARIKKIMKLDENAKMIAAEAPLLFAKACEYFIQELTMRAWIHTEESKRRTLQRSDIAQAIAIYDQFDFLIDIVPREDIKPTTTSTKKESPSVPQQSTATSTTTATPSITTESASVKVEPQGGSLVTYTTLAPEALTVASNQNQTNPQPHQQQLQILQQAAAQPQQMQYFVTIPGQQPGQPQLVQQLQMPQSGLGTNALAPQIAGLNLVAQQPQQLILATGPNGQLTATPAQHPQQQTIQLVQQVMTPTGELTNVPITINANQLNLLRLQMQQQQQHQQQQAPQPQVIIPTQCLTAQQLLQLSTAAGTVIPTAAAHNHAMQQQQQQQQQHQQQQQQQNSNITANNYILNSQPTTSQVVSSDRNNFRSNC